MSTAIEIAGAVFGLLSVIFTVVESVWCWPTGIINTVLFLYMFFQVRLYAELITYSMFLVLGIYGWWEWARRGPHAEKLHVRVASPARRALIVALCVVLSPALGFCLAHYTDAALPWVDSVITVLSLVAQWLLAEKWVENWVLWIIVDVLGIGVYLAKHLWYTSALYAVFLVLASLGLRTWILNLRERRAIIAA